MFCAVLNAQFCCLLVCFQNNSHFLYIAFRSNHSHSWQNRRNFITGESWRDHFRTNGIHVVQRTHVGNFLALEEVPETAEWYKIAAFRLVFVLLLIKVELCLTVYWYVSAPYCCGIRECNVYFLFPGLMFPTIGDLHIAPFSDEMLYMEQFTKANFWYQQSFHGVDLSPLRDDAVRTLLCMTILFREMCFFAVRASKRLIAVIF